MSVNKNVRTLGEEVSVSRIPFGWRSRPREKPVWGKRPNPEDLFYWTSSGKAEVDFIFAANDLVHPLEAKAGVNPKSKSLKVYQKKYNPHELSRTTLLYLKKDGGIIYQLPPLCDFAFSFMRSTSAWRSVRTSSGSMNTSLSRLIMS